MADSRKVRWATRGGFFRSFSRNGEGHPNATRNLIVAAVMEKSKKLLDFAICPIILDPSFLPIQSTLYVKE
jgi:hypothetical protein